MLKKITNVNFGLIKTYNDSKVKTTSGFIEKLFGGGTNTNKAGYYILWSRGSGIVNYANNGLAK